MMRDEMTSAPPEFDRRAARYDTHAAMQKEAAAWLAEWLPASIDGPALELGAGTGIFTRHLLDRGAQLIATDFAPKMVETGTEKSGQARWVVADAATPPDGDAYRWIFACSLVQWLPDPAAAFRRWHELADPSAHLVAGWFVAGTMENFFRSSPTPSPCVWRNPEQWKALLDDAGWRVTRIETCTFVRRHADTRGFLREIHNLGAFVPRRLGAGKLRGILRSHDTAYRKGGTLETPFVFMRAEATRK